MDWGIVGIECICAIVLFTGVFLLAYMRQQRTAPGEISIHNYPPDIQKAYLENHEHVIAPRNARVMARKLVALGLCAIVLAGTALLAGANSFWDGALFGFVIFMAIGIWDVLVIDWVFFTHLKGVRLPGTEHMDDAYAQKWFHVKVAILPGLLFALLTALITGCAVVGLLLIL